MVPCSFGCGSSFKELGQPGGFGLCFTHFEPFGRSSCVSERVHQFHSLVANQAKTALALVSPGPKGY